MLEFKYEKIVAIFLEELVHAIMNVSDEELTHKIVCELYDKVQFFEGTYSVKEPN